MHESEFFPGGRRKFTLCDYRQLKTSGGEKRKKLLIESAIDSNGSLVSMPEWIAEPYLLLQKDQLSADQVHLGKEVTLESMTCEIYATDRSPKRALLLTGCTFKKFVVLKRGVEDKATFAFSFVAYVPDSTELHNWIRTHHMMEFFAGFEAGQLELGEEKRSAPFDPDAIKSAAESGTEEDEDLDYAEMAAADPRLQ